MMIPLEKFAALPQTHHITIPIDYLDEMGHMNIQYYFRLYDRAAWELFAWFGVDWPYMEARSSGMFALKQFVQYLAEVHVGQMVTIRSRVLGLSAKRLHFIHFMINETTGKLASTLEVVGSYADLVARRTAPFPPEIAHIIAQRLAEHQALDWEAPVCGVLQA